MSFGTCVRVLTAAVAPGREAIACRDIEQRATVLQVDAGGHGESAENAGAKQRRPGCRRRPGGAGGTHSRTGISRSARGGCRALGHRGCSPGSLAFREHDTRLCCLVGRGSGVGPGAQPEGRLVLVVVFLIRGSRCGSKLQVFRGLIDRNTLHGVTVGRTCMPQDVSPQDIVRGEGVARMATGLGSHRSISREKGEGRPRVRGVEGHILH